MTPRSSRCCSPGSACWPRPIGSRAALVASNPGSGLPLLETFSQNTVRELRNAGVSTTALIGKDLEQDKLRKRCPIMRSSSGKGTITR